MSDREAINLARDLVRGSIIEDAAARFISQVLKEAHDSRIKPLRNRFEALQAERDALEAKLAKAVERLDKLARWLDIDDEELAAVPIEELPSDHRHIQKQVEITIAELKGKTNDPR